MSARTGLDKVWASAGEAVADIASGSLVAVGCCPRVGCAAWSRRTSGRTRSSPVSTSRGARGGADAVRNAGRTAAVRWVRYPGFLHRDRVGIQVADGGPPWKYDADANVVMSSPEKETRSFNGRDYVLERTIVCDFGLVRAWKGDRHGNLVYRRSARNFSPLAAMSGRITIAEVEELVEPGSLDPDQVHNPGTCPLRSTRFCPCSAQYRPAARSSRSHPARCRRLSMPTLPGHGSTDGRARSSAATARTAHGMADQDPRVTPARLGRLTRLAPRAAGRRTRPGRRSGRTPRPGSRRGRSGTSSAQSRGHRRRPSRRVV